MTSLNVTLVDMSQVFADDDFNCRGVISPTDVVDLVKDIDRHAKDFPESHGLIQPVVITPLSKERQIETGRLYLLVAGYRRYMSFRVLQRDQIPCLIQEGLDEETARVLNLSENLKREDLNLLQEARAIHKLKMLGISEFSVADRLGVSRGWVQVRFLLLDLPEDIQEHCSEYKFTQAQIRDLRTIMKQDGLPAVYDAVKELKSSKAAGAKGKRIESKQRRAKTKRQRTGPEIISMIEHFSLALPKAISFGLHTRCLSWAAGEITDMELYLSIREYAEEAGCVSYKSPVDVEDTI